QASELCHCASRRRPLAGCRAGNAGGGLTERMPGMETQASLIRELEASIRDGSHVQRVNTLRRVTDLFIDRAEQYDSEQVLLFDNVIGRLAAEIEKAALAELAGRLAPVPNAPPMTVGKLARDEDIEVAGPVLAQSTRLTEADL